MEAIIEDPLSAVDAINGFRFRFSEISDRQDTASRLTELTWEAFCERCSDPDRARSELSSDESRRRRSGPIWAVSAVAARASIFGSEVSIVASDAVS